MEFTESQRVVQHNEEGFVHAQILVQKLKHSAEKACYLEYKQTSEAEEQLKSLMLVYQFLCHQHLCCVAYRDCFVIQFCGVVVVTLRILDSISKMACQI